MLWPFLFHLLIRQLLACQGLWERRFHLNKQEKGQVITDLRNKLSKARSVVYTDYKGMTVAEMTDLRILLQSSAIDYSVVKNTLAKIASQDTSFSVAAGIFKGPVGIAIGYDDPVLAVKRVLEYVKKNEKLKVTGAVVEGQLYGAKDLKEIAELPSREVLLSMLAGTLQAPMAKLAGALSATVTSFAYAMESLKSKKNN